MQHIFVYGTLQSPQIVEKLTGKSFNTTRAVLPGYKLFCVKNADYPAIVKNENAVTTGLIIENADNASLAVISFYEGDEYEIQKVTVLVDGKPVPALVFVWAKSIELLENREWDFQRFKRVNLEYYLNEVIPETLKKLRSY